MVCVCKSFVDGGWSLPWISCWVISEQNDREKIAKDEQEMEW